MTKPVIYISDVLPYNKGERVIVKDTGSPVFAGRQGTVKRFYPGPFGRDHMIGVNIDGLGLVVFEPEDLYADG